MTNGVKNLPKFYDQSTGTYKQWNGRDSVAGLISTDVVQCANASATLIASVTYGKSAYVVFINVKDTSGAAQDFTLADANGSKLTLRIGANDTKSIKMSNIPFLKLDEGAVTGQAGTADFVEVTMTYWEQ